MNVAGDLEDRVGEKDMNAEKRQEIGRLADAVRSALKISGFPIKSTQLEAAVERMGGRVVDSSENHASEASIRKVGESFEIALDPNKPPTRKLFSLAHELGHLFVHMGYGNAERWSKSSDYKESYERSGYDEEEFVANEFAAALLMPEAAFKEIVKSGKPLKDVAKHFGVSQEAAVLRGRWLKLYSWTEA